MRSQSVCSSTKKLVVILSGLRGVTLCNTFHPLQLELEKQEVDVDTWNKLAANFLPIPSRFFCYKYERTYLILKRCLYSMPLILCKITNSIPSSNIKPSKCADRN
ncbi:hypothetical protein KIN20_023854 [Parelaphostrongylus tenuis]|uniref:Uncharacterized protein n=1 Tax=Parelaphostrongylus tenuis TaxID=148309 RepID=A0AAD5QW17_PARTN|nr:hypothetical protein KIN20_023854 [Parelaphostrongylus tenuis]